jgi:phosphopantetheine--protein transferase-like protein
MKVGTDIVRISRLEGAKDSFIDGVLSAQEIEEYKKRTNKAEFLAGHYAAKEAFLKALGTGLSGAPLKEIEICYEKSGAPYLKYRGKRYEMSISHDGGYAISVVLIS